MKRLLLDGIHTNTCRNHMLRGTNESILMKASDDVKDTGEGSTKKLILLAFIWIFPSQPHGLSQMLSSHCLPCS